MMAGSPNAELEVMNITLQELDPSTSVWDLVCREGDKGGGGLRLRPSSFRPQDPRNGQCQSSRCSRYIWVAEWEPWCESNLWEAGGCNHDGYERA